MKTLFIMNSPYNEYIASAQVEATDANTIFLDNVLDAARDEEFDRASDLVEFAGATNAVDSEVISIAESIVDTLRYCGTVFCETQHTDFSLPASWEETKVYIVENSNMTGEWKSVRDLLYILKHSREFSRLQRRQLLARLLIKLYESELNEFTDMCFCFYAENDINIVNTNSRQFLRLTSLDYDFDNVNQTLRDFADGLLTQTCANKPEVLNIITDKVLNYFRAVFKLGLTPFDERLCAEAGYGVFEAAKYFGVTDDFDFILSDVCA